MAGEFAYSYASNTLFIGTPDGNGVVNVGGQYYTSTLDAATSANIASALVRRDSNGAFSGRLFGLANSALQLEDTRTFNVSGGDISASAENFNGTQNVTLNASLNAIPGLTGGTVGSGTEIPVITYAANGRILAVSTASATSVLNIAGETGTDAVNLLSEVLTFDGTNGIITSVASNTVTISVDDTILRTNTSLGGATQVIETDVQITGNLTITGNTLTLDVVSLNVTDPMIFLAANNTTGDLVDIGFTGHYFDGTSQRHTGVYRHAANKQYYIYDNYPLEPANNVIIPSTPGFRLATVHANLTSGFISGLANTIGIHDGGTGTSSFNPGQFVYYNGSSLASIANTGTAGTYGEASYVPIITTDAYGRVSNVSNTQIGINASQVVDGTLDVSRGGTGQDSFTAGSIIIGNGISGLLTLANSTFTPTGTGAQNNTITSVTVDAYGRFTAATFSAIGGLTVAQGGTGASSFTTNGIVYGNGSGALQITAAAGDADQSWSNQILTVNNSGTPTWSTALDGGTF